MSGLLVPSFDDVLRFGGAQPFLEPAMFGRMAGRLVGTGPRFSFGSDAEIDGWSEGTYLVRVRPAALSNNTVLLAKTASGSIDGFMLQHTSAGNLQLQRDWSTTDANYITSDAPLEADQWIDVVVVIRNSTSGSLSIYAAPLGQPPVERSYGTSTNGAGSINTADGANNLIVGNRTTATTVSFNGDYALMVAIKRALTDVEVRRLTRDPREFIGDRDCWVWGVIGHVKFNNANVSMVNLAQNGLTNNVVRLGTGGGTSTIPCAGPFPVVGAADHLRRFWAVDVPVTGGISGDGAGTLVFSGSGAGTVAIAGAGAGTVVFSGSGAGTVAIAGAGAGTIVFSGSGDGSVAVAGAGAGTIVFSGSGSGGAAGISGDGAGVVAFSGSGAGSVAVTGSGAGTVLLNGTGTGTVAIAGAGAGTIVFSGSGAGGTGVASPTIRRTVAALQPSRLVASLAVSRTIVVEVT